jgi:hypothetical protein
MLAAIVFPVGFLAFFNGYSTHRKPIILILAVLGFIGLAIGLFYGTPLIDTTATVIGGLLLSIAHLLNLRAHRA